LNLFIITNNNEILLLKKVLYIFIKNVFKKETLI